MPRQHATIVMRGARLGFQRRLVQKQGDSYLGDWRFQGVLNWHEAEDDVTGTLPRGLQTDRWIFSERNPLAICSDHDYERPRALSNSHTDGLSARMAISVGTAVGILALYPVDRAEAKWSEMVQPES